MPSPQTMAPTSAPLPSSHASLTRCSAILSHSPFTIRTSLFVSRSSVWYAPIFTNWFSDVTRPDIDRVAPWEAEGEDEEPAGFPEAVADEDGAFDEETAAEKCIFSTRSVRVVLTLRESVEPVADSVCTRLDHINLLWFQTRTLAKIYLIAGALTSSP